MRAVIMILACLWFTGAYSQAPLVYHSFDYNRPLLLSLQQEIPLTSSHWRRPWQLTTFSGVTAGCGMGNAGNFTMLSAPVGLQLTRRLNNNWYAFADASAAPVFYGFNAFATPAFNKGYPGNMMFNANRFAISSNLGGGLLYTNDERTFSISGSVHFERNSYPLYPSYRTGMNAQPSR